MKTPPHPKGVVMRMFFFFQLFVVMMFGCAPEIQETPAEGWAINETEFVQGGEDCDREETLQMDSLSVELHDAGDMELLEITDEGTLEMPSGAWVAYAKGLVSSKLAVNPVKYSISCTGSCELIDEWTGSCAMSGCEPVFPDEGSPSCSTIVCTDANICTGSCTQKVTATREPAALSLATSK